MEMESCVPPGFRFFPTEEELVGYYLKRKINSLKIDLDVIIDIDLYKIEPWDIQARCKLGYDEQNEWYFFSHKDRKYPTGTRTNRATATGFWKATGRDKAVLSKNKIIGMRKTLVFYKGRAPNGRKTDWIVHEYRLQTSEHGPPQEEGWVVCRAFKKPIPSQRPNYNEAWNNNPAFSANISPQAFSDTVATTHMPIQTNQTASFHQQQQQQPFGSDPADQVVSSHPFLENNKLINLPQLDSPSTLSTSFATREVLHNINGVSSEDFDKERSNNTNSTQFIDWKNLDSLLASQVNDSMPSMPQSYEISHFLGCFPDS
ncbi:NAC domain-containing protein 30 [Manihot esculenta]|uniref:NAC transcription factors 96 n=2 Tax=Manihot esculenta TaxID=3983 RepID=A0A0M4FP50_MANES|nr:NAC domain-containing protein 30 [Manihot esculenta]ALC79073.1 NAC transcription factors 96 [Manihot esculenta]KAG8633397.1 hypothetical protein MANES_18G100800v8 [Manihot esculenta]OAY23708.1 hypothetical protein MANES_18G100800v8 [Manihot esculenta]